MLKAIKKDGQEIMFDTLNINNYNIKGELLKGYIYEPKKNVSQPQKCGRKLGPRHEKQRTIIGELAFKLT
jgi:hypothetical protein